MFARIKSALAFLANARIKDVILWTLIVLMALWFGVPCVCRFTPGEIAQWASVRGIPAIIGKWIAAW